MCPGGAARGAVVPRTSDDYPSFVLHAGGRRAGRAGCPSADQVRRASTATAVADLRAPYACRVRRRSQPRRPGRRRHGPPAPARTRDRRRARPGVPRRRGRAQRSDRCGMRRREQPLVLGQRGLIEHREDLPATVGEHHEDRVEAETRGPEERACVVQEGQIAEEGERRSRAACGNAERRGDQAVDPAGASVPDDRSRSRRGPDARRAPRRHEHVEIANRRRGADHSVAPCGRNDATSRATRPSNGSSQASSSRSVAWRARRSASRQASVQLRSAASIDIASPVVPCQRCEQLRLDGDPPLGVALGIGLRWSRSKTTSASAAPRAVGVARVVGIAPTCSTTSGGWLASHASSPISSWPAASARPARPASRRSPDSGSARTGHPRSAPSANSDRLAAVPARRVAITPRRPA